MASIFSRTYRYFLAATNTTTELYVYKGHETVPKNVTLVHVHKSVTAISDKAFEECRDLKEVVLPEGLIEIRHGAFSDCTSLKDINFPSTLRVIGESAFGGCYSLARADFNKGLRMIGRDSFYGCRSILHLKIPSTVTTIGNGAFVRCFALKDVQLCDGLQTIESYAFYGCCSLLRIKIPSSVTTIGSCAFLQCNLLRNVAIAPGFTLGQEKLEESCLFRNLHQVECSLDLVKVRFDHLPLHGVCFHQAESQSFVEKVKEHAMKENLVKQDCLGMTPLHVFACSGRHDVGVYKIFVDVYPEALLIKDRWGGTPLAYAILSEAPQDMIHFLMGMHSKSLNGSLQFDFLVMVEKVAKRKGADAEFLRSIIQAQRTHFPTLEIEWEKIVNENIKGDINLKVFRVLVEARFSKRLNCMSSEHQLAIDHLINEIDTGGRQEGDGEQIVDLIQDYYAQLYLEWLEDATTVLELALWNAAENATGRNRVCRRQKGANIDELGPREESRVNCGAGFIIPLVLPFL